MMFLPRSLSAISDAKNALGRLSNVFHAEIMTEAPFVTDPNQSDALIVKNATFEWEAVANSNDKNEKEEDESFADDVQPFQVRNVSMNVPRGSLVGIVGRVGSGKVIIVWWHRIVQDADRTSVKSTAGLNRRDAKGSRRSVFLWTHCLLPTGRLDSECDSGTTYSKPTDGYLTHLPQRDNILFGQPFDEDRYWQAIEDACLSQDLLVLSGM